MKITEVLKDYAIVIATTIFCLTALIIVLIVAVIFSPVNTKEIARLRAENALLKERMPPTPEENDQRFLKLMEVMEECGATNWIDVHEAGNIMRFSIRRPAKFDVETHTLRATLELQPMKGGDPHFVDVVLFFKYDGRVWELDWEKCESTSQSGDVERAIKITREHAFGKWAQELYARCPQISRK